jgi:hypothetical protein
MNRRNVHLSESHADRFAALSVDISEDHASLNFEGFWHRASIAMTHGELEAVRDAINAVLVESGR